MPERPDYAMLIRGHTLILDRINAGDAGLTVLNRLVQLAQEATGACGAVFVEHGPGSGAESGPGRVIAATGACAPALGRPLDLTDSPLATGPRTRHTRPAGPGDIYAGLCVGTPQHMLASRCEIGGFVFGSLHLYYDAVDHGPGEEHHAVLSMLASSVAHNYGHQAGLPVHGDGPMVANPSDGLAIVDPDGVVQLWNPAAEQLTGCTAEETLGHRLPFPVPPSGEIRAHRLPTGRWLKVTAGDLTGTPSMRVVTFRDAGARAQPQEHRDLFVAVTSHELRTPVTVIKGYADTLTHHWDSLDEPGRREAIRVIGARAGVLARLVDRLLAATSDTGPVDGSAPGPFDLTEALRTAVEDLPADLRRRMVTDGLPTDLPKAYGDRESLATILTELATNADKYSPPGTAVELSADADEHSVLFRVSDHGIGVPPEHVERAFERYWQGGSGEHPGAGLGLYLVRRIVERQHGWVALRPRPGGGTVVEVRLPRG